MGYNIFLPVIYSKDEISKLNALLNMVQMSIEEEKKIIITLYGEKIDKDFISLNLKITQDSEVYVCLNEWFHFDENIYVDAISSHIELFKPDIVVGISNSFTKSILSRVATRFSSGIVSDCFDINYDSIAKKFVFLKPAYGNNIDAKISIKNSPIIFATIKIKGGFECIYKPSQDLNLQELSCSFSEDQYNLKFIEKILNEDIDNNIESAKIIIGVGRGIKKKENLKYAFELAKVLNAAVGVTRPLVDEGWIEKSYQIGQTGKMISPDIYFAFGISGAVHHICGIGKPKMLIAINTDKEAGIFKLANYGIVGDATEYLKIFTKKFQEKLKPC